MFLFKQKLNWDNKKFIDTNFWLSLESHRVAYHPSISFSFCLFFCWTFCPCWTCWNWESWRLAISYRVPVGPNKTARRAFFKSPFWTVHSSISIPILVPSLSTPFLQTSCHVRGSLSHETSWMAKWVAALPTPLPLIHWIIFWPFVNLDADFLKANYFARPKFLLGNFA